VRFQATTFALACALARAQVEPPAESRDWGALYDLVEQHCGDCHGGDAPKGRFDLLALPQADAVTFLDGLARARDRVEAGEMPPVDAEPMPAAARAAFAEFAAATVRRGVPRLPADPGRVTIRRLSRAEWERTVHDLFGVATAKSAAFPADVLAYGFDNIGAAASLSTLHLEKYLDAAADVAAQVFDGEDPARPAVRRLEAEQMAVVQGPGVGQDGDFANLYTRAEVAAAVALPRDGVYVLRVHAGADQAGAEPAKLVVRLDGRDLEEFEVAHRAPKIVELRTALLGGPHRFGLLFPNDFYDPDNPDPKRRDRNLRLDWLEIVGPTDARQRPPQQAWLAAADRAPAAEAPAAKASAVKAAFAARAAALARALVPRVFRRAARPGEVERLAKVATAAAAAGDPEHVALQQMLQAALVAPHFLFRGEESATPPAAGPAPLPGPALAVRLSYLVWSSAPDERLRELGASGRLGAEAVLLGELQRLLADPRSEALASNFAAQWLELKNLADRAPDPTRFPGFDDALRASLRRETELLVLAVLREDRDVRDLLDCDFTHVDARLAAFYGVEGAAGDEFVRVALPAAAGRGGVLGHASILAVTSNPTRTSPVKRGKWILENLLGAPPPPPPPGNDTLKEEAKVTSSASFREQLAAHRDRKECRGCHVRMDALGFALEHFDAIGRFRAQDAGGAIDAVGELQDGRRLDGLPGLQAALRSDPAFVRTVARKLFVYGVGRDLRPVDRLRLDAAVAERLLEGKVTFADLLAVVVLSDAFRFAAGG
jgi:mono/diheme cytochrome c family protein